MKIAVTYENGKVFQNFGKCESFMIFEIDNSKIVNSSILESNGVIHGALAGLLSKNQVDILICGEISGGALNALKICDIQVISDCCGSVDEVIEDFLNGKLKSTGGECFIH